MFLRFKTQIFGSSKTCFSNVIHEVFFHKKIFLIVLPDVYFIIFFYSLPELRNKIVLTPQFLVNALKSLITAEMFCKKRPDVLDSWKEFRQKGILKPNLLGNQVLF